MEPFEFLLMIETEAGNPDRLEAAIIACPDHVWRQFEGIQFARSLFWVCPHCDVSEAAATPAAITPRPVKWMCYCENAKDKRRLRRSLGSFEAARQRARRPVTWKPELDEYPWGSPGGESMNAPTRCSCWRPKDRRHHIEAFLTSEEF